MNDDANEKVTFPAIETRQRDTVSFAGAMDIHALEKLYKIDVWHADEPIERRGIQRQPIAAHYRKIGRSLQAPEATLPTSIVLSANINHDGTESHISDGIRVPYGMEVTPVQGTIANLVDITIDPSILKLQVVDGQHRILGIEHALEKGYLRQDQTFELPFVLILAKSRYDEIKNFYSINSKAKRVATDLALQLMNEMKDSDPDYNLSLTEKKKVIAIKIANALSDKADSPWYGEISQGNTASSEEIISSTSFVSSLTPVLTVSYFNNVIKAKGGNAEAMMDMVAEQCGKTVDNYWSAIRDLLPFMFEGDLSKWVIQKTPGVYSLHLVLANILENYFLGSAGGGQVNLSREAFLSFLKDYAPDVLSDPDTARSYWKAANGPDNPGGDASFANSSQAFKQLADEIISEIHENYGEHNKPKLTF